MKTVSALRRGSAWPTFSTSSRTTSGGSARETAGSARRTPLSSPLDPLVDVLVHGQDIARPLGRVRAIPADLLPVALDHFWTSKFYGTQKRFHGLRLIATDLNWTAGDGPHEVRRPAADLLLLASGRPAGLAALTGPGLDRARTAVGVTTGR